MEVSAFSKRFLWYNYSLLQDCIDGTDDGELCKTPYIYSEVYFTEVVRDNSIFFSKGYVTDYSEDGYRNTHGQNSKYEHDSDSTYKQNQNQESENQNEEDLKEKLSVCPDTHFQCPGSYCLPVYMRCNGVLDCPEHQDEHDCDVFVCPGYYRLVLSIFLSIFPRLSPGSSFVGLWSVQVIIDWYWVSFSLLPNITPQ